MNNFRDLGLCEEIVNQLTYKAPTAIQSGCISHLLNGKDLLGIAQTGTGKTAAFALPLVQKILKEKINLSSNEVRFLIIAPTRELATQIDQNISSYSAGCGITSTVAIGGVSKEEQLKKLSKGSDFLIATPGRLLDFIRGGEVSFSKLSALVLDEADMMLDYGFLDDVNEIISQLPSERQTILFSATMPKAIADLAKSILRNPIRVEIEPESTVAKRVLEKLYYVSAENKNYLLCSLLNSSKAKRVIVFCKAKYSVPIIVDILEKSGISCTEIHSNRSQRERDQAILDFSEGNVKVLVATDIAARGIDVSDVTHVVNYNLPEDSSYYVHRVGRTARAGRDGVAISLCVEKELPLLRNIQKKISRNIPLVENHPFHEALTSASVEAIKAPKSFNRRKRARRK
ncbi:DEAD/DEAH box helicase [Halobacteriovorax sp. JY17]|uniref:DEAD/DEAH box helicase n=1 Tax=Halobacteriovorax sp. JY17 TaxID=2014617 RepID=UPI000C45D11C|nr:DEAD/DEAH box helicase [Halobacteriovorax sp. JY17]PIK15211.1 MAG: DEAD/DEAH box helicase [Halobacteriovorax sp. JY17]